MKDCNNNVRTIYVNALNGHLTLLGKNVPVYGQPPFVTVPEKYVIINNISETATNTNDSFGNNVEVTIEIYSEQNKNNDVSQVDNVSGQILNILIPTTRIVGFSDSDFIIYPLERTNSIYLPLWDGDNYIARKIITIKNLVNQK